MDVCSYQSRLAVSRELLFNEYLQDQTETLESCDVELQTLLGQVCFTERPCARVQHAL
jgi:hypothetical protein